MKLNDESLKMMLYAMGKAVLELSLANRSITRQSIIDKLERYREQTCDPVSKGVNRDAAEIVRKGCRVLN